MATHSIFLPGEEKPGRLYSSWGRKDSETTETT